MTRAEESDDRFAAFANLMCSAQGRRRFGFSPISRFCSFWPAFEYALHIEVPQE
jgi:hypothetical protein